MVVIARRLRPAAALALALALVMSASAAIVKGPYVQNVTTSEATICWVNDAEKPGSVQYGAAEPLDKEIASSTAAKRHEVKISDLTPGTTYLYRVVTNGVASAPGRFTTAPAEPVPFKFAVFGDTRSGHDTHRKIVEQILAFEPAFVVNTGDLVGNGTKPEDWDMFFDISRHLMRQVPYYPALGNHERNSPLYFEYFALPGNERWYSFDWGNCHFVVLDSNEPSDPYIMSQEQKGWLYEDLSSVKWGKFVFVVLHSPIYSGTANMNRRMGAREVRDQLGAVLEEYGVDIVFSGHDHNYQHTEVNGVHYVVTGGGGAGLYAVSPRPGFSKQAAVHHWCKVFVNGDKVTVNAITVDGKALDSFSISRPPAQ